MELLRNRFTPRKRAPPPPAPLPPPPPKKKEREHALFTSIKRDKNSELISFTAEKKRII